MLRARCAVEGCEKEARVRGWCPTHYERWRHNGDPGTIGDARKRPKLECSMEGCTVHAIARGWCAKHYARWQRHGDPEINLRPGYGFGKNYTNGYVRVWCPGHPEAHADGYAFEHRKVWHDANGPIPDRFEIHHKNEVRSDNALTNLEIKEAGVHQSEHNQKRGTVSNQYGTWPLRNAC